VFPPYRAWIFGAGTVIGTNAVIHLIMAQGVALGFLGLLGLTDYWAWRHGKGSPESWAKLLKRYLTFGTVVSSIGGAVTGAGIWFTIGTLAPRATASMLRIFLWPWFTEWLVFFLEVVAVLVLYFAWEWLGRYRRLRIALAVLYAGYSFLSAVLITGILGFMLTVGDWPEKGGLLAAFLNPSFLPQLLARVSLAGILGVLFAMVLAYRRGIEREVRESILRPLGVVLLLSIATFIPALAWYLLVVPDFYTTRKVYAVLTQHLSQNPWIFYGANLLALLLMLVIAGAGIIRKASLVRVLMIPGLVAAAGWVAEMERVREFIRGPYLMPSHMYVSEVLLPETPLYREQGMRPAQYWHQRLGANGNLDQMGAELFDGNCMLCHTIGGLNNIRARVAGRSEDGLAVILDHTRELVSFMPPFSGDALERRLAARFLFRLGQGKLEMASRNRMRVEPRGTP
jgi:hypothetical protein